MNTLITAEQLRRAVPGGIGTYVRGLLQGLQHEPDQYVGLWASKKLAGTDPLAGFGLPVYESRLPSKLLTRAWDRGVVKPPKGWHLVHATSTAVPPKTRVPMTVSVADVAWRTFPDAYPPRGRAWHEASLQRAIERADKLITPSRATANDLIDGGVDPSQIVVIPLGCDHLPEPDVRSALEKLNQAQVFGDYILAVGTLEPRKNLARLIKAYERVRGDLPEDMALVIVGPPGWGAEVEPVDGVHFVKSATPEELTAFYDRAQLFVSVPVLEGFGLPVIEAMSRGVPVVSSAVPSAGDATYRVDPNNTAGIGEALVRVLDDDIIRADLITKGRRHAASLTWAECARSHVEVWETLL